MEDQRLPVHRTIVVVDVEGFGNQHRTNPHQVAVRDGLYGAMRDAFGKAGIRWDACGVEDRGDGIFVLVPPEVPRALLAESLPSALVTALQAHNGAHPGPQRLQSVAEAELRSQRDFAEELLAGADEPTVKASAHALGYDPERPHRVIVATGARTPASTSNSSRPSSVRCAASTWPR